MIFDHLVGQIFIVLPVGSRAIIIKNNGEWNHQGKDIEHLEWN